MKMQKKWYFLNIFYKSRKIHFFGPRSFQFWKKTLVARLHGPHLFTFGKPSAGHLQLAEQYFGRAWQKTQSQFYFHVGAVFAGLRFPDRSLSA